MRILTGLLLFGCMSLHAQSLLTIDAGAAISIGPGADVCANNLSLLGTLSGGGTYCGGPTGIGTEDVSSVPADVVLWQNYPNPFNPVTTIRYALPKRGDVSIVVYDVFGREVARVAEGPRDAGIHSVEWDAGDVAGGVYYYRLRADNFSETKRLVVLR